MSIYWRTKTFSTFLLFSDQCSMLTVSMLCTTNDLYMISLVLSELFSYTDGMITTAEDTRHILVRISDRTSTILIYPS